VWKIILIIASIGFTIALNDQGFLGIIPAAVCTVYIIFMDIKDPVKFKLLVTLSFVPWAIYHFVLKSYTGAAFDALTVVTSTVTLIKMIMDSRKEKAKKAEDIQ
jgi:hypothetical protein